MKKILKKIFLMAAVIIGCVLIFLIILAFKKPAGTSDKIEWGVSFSRPFMAEFGLDWKNAYSAILDDLKAKRIRLPVYWQDVEPEKGKYVFNDYDWMISEAQKNGASLILAVGRRLPRWPECHEPGWASGLPQEEKEAKILAYVKETILRYKDAKNIAMWQIENEPFLLFGDCSITGADFFNKEIKLVKSIDSSRPVLVTDSGELGLWLPTANYGDVFGTSIYRKVYNQFFGYIKYPLPPEYFWMKANLTRIFYPNKSIVVSELQAEPWLQKMLYETTPEEQFQKMNFDDFRDNINYAKQVGFPEVYLWGSEWWYWLKTEQNHPEFWQAVKVLINK